jgi:hypothetical protein
VIYTAADHTFVICAYRENPHLEDCIHSLRGQTVKSRIILSTSTPNSYVASVCRANGVEMYVKPVHLGPGDDWNFGYSQAKTPLVTIAHQDDLYEPEFLSSTLRLAGKRPDVIMTFTDYYELRGSKRVDSNKIMRIKRIINSPLLVPALQGSKFVRRRALSVGCAICCPAATFVKANAGENIFDTKYINSCDYETWVELASKNGAFIYSPEKLIGHRIYAGSATAKNISENIRNKEDFEILCNFWPRPIASIISKLYATSENSNQL